MSTINLQEKYNEINPKATVLKECISLADKIDDIIDNILPNLKIRLEAMLANGKAVDVISVEAEAEIQVKLTKVDKALATEVAVLEEVIEKEIINLGK